jgi:hypothetical protein
MSSIQYNHGGPNIQQGTTGDPISHLPVDQSQPTSNELQIVNTLFTTHKNTVNTIVQEVKDSMLIGVLFVVFSLPMIDNLIKRILPLSEKSPYILVVTKALAVMALYWLINHFYLSRKN